MKAVLLREIYKTCTNYLYDGYVFEKTNDTQTQLPGK